MKFPLTDKFMHDGLAHVFRDINELLFSMTLSYGKGDQPEISVPNVKHVLFAFKVPMPIKFIIHKINRISFGECGIIKEVHIRGTSTWKLPSNYDVLIPDARFGHESDEDE